MSLYLPPSPEQTIHQLRMAGVERGDLTGMRRVMNRAERRRRKRGRR